MKNNVAYKDIKNYIHNELGITKEYVQDVIKEIVAIEVDKKFNDEEYIKNEVRRIIVHELNNEVDKSHWHTIHDLSSLVKDEITKTIMEEVRSKVVISLK